MLRDRYSDCTVTVLLCHSKPVQLFFVCERVFQSLDELLATVEFVMRARCLWFNINTVSSQGHFFGHVGGGQSCSLHLLPLVVAIVHVQKHVSARDASVQLGADEEGAGHLAVEGVRLLRRRREPVSQHDGDEVLDALGGALGSEVKGLAGGKGFSQDHHCLHVGFGKRLVSRRPKVEKMKQASAACIPLRREFNTESDD